MPRLAQTAQGPGASAPDAQFATNENPAKAQKLGKLRRANAPGASAWISCQVDRLSACHADMYCTVNASIDGGPAVAIPKKKRLVHEGATKTIASRIPNQQRVTMEIQPRRLIE